MNIDDLELWLKQHRVPLRVSECVQLLQKFELALQISPSV